MKQPPHLRGGLLGSFVLLLVSASVISLVGCEAGEAGRPVEAVRPAEKPPAPDLSTPESAIGAYTDWISYAYRRLDSDVASSVCSPSEAVRVDSYVEYNRQQGRAIEQELVGSKYVAQVSGDSTSIVAGHERWRYRYLDTEGAAYLAPAKDVTYDVTYTVIALAGRGWVVESVEATSSGSP